MTRSGRNAVLGSRSSCTRQRSVIDLGRCYFARMVAICFSAVAITSKYSAAKLTNPLTCTVHAKSSTWLDNMPNSAHQ